MLLQWGLWPCLLSMDNSAKGSPKAQLSPTVLMIQVGHGQFYLQAFMANSRTCLPEQSQVGSPKSSQCYSGCGLLTGSMLQHAGAVKVLQQALHVWRQLTGYKTYVTAEMGAGRVLFSYTSEMAASWGLI